jgi:hypothetical protein
MISRRISSVVVLTVEVGRGKEAEWVGALAVFIDSGRG